MMNFFRILLIPALLAGCADIWTVAPPQQKVVPITVETFSRLPDGISGKKVKVTPITAKQNSIEYEVYGESVKNGFSSIGWKVVGDDDQADFIAIFDYVTDGGIDHIETETAPQFGQTGIGSAQTSGYANALGGYSTTTTFSPTYGIVGYREIKRRVTDYGHAASVSIFAMNDGAPENVFLGVSSKSTRKEGRRKLIEHLFAAVFMNFHNNGEDVVYVPTGEFVKRCGLWCS